MKTAAAGERWALIANLSKSLLEYSPHHVVSISSILIVCHLNVPEVLFYSSIPKSSLITVVPRRYVGRYRGGGIP